jgi:putative ABC transport system substrate-binding protein
MKLGAAAFALALGFPAAPLAAEVQQRAARIGLLGNAPSPAIEAFRRGLRDLGWIEGQNIAIEFRWFQGRPERLPELAEELVKLKLDVILAGSSTQVEPLRQKTRTIPIVFGSHADPVGAGHVASLARPGGNITGVSYPHTELNAKKLEVLKDLIPGVMRIAVLWNPTTPSHPPALRAIEAAARQLEVRIQMVEARVVEDFEGAFSEMARGKAQAFLALGSPLSFAHGAQLAGLAVKHRLPGVFDFKENAEAGGLMSYGIDISDSMRRSAVYVDKILKGAKPAELPVEEAAKFEMVVNLKTARALGLGIPQSILTRADRVIE